MRFVWPLIILLLASCSNSVGVATDSDPAAVIAADSSGAVLTSGDVESLLAAALADSHAYHCLNDLCTLVGPRLNGSPGYAAAVEWAAETMRLGGLDKVWTDSLTVPNWIRGEERAEIVSPRRFTLPILGLGGSVGTPPQGIKAPLLTVASFEELTARAAEASGRIVLFAPHWEGYGKTVEYRGHGAVRAAECGAVACLIRSVTPRSLSTLHTGVMRYDEGDTIPRIPAAAVSVENAMLLLDMDRRGTKTEVEMFMGARTDGESPSANVLGELTGRENPQEIVVIGAHLDSWDVGTCAHDDGGGCVIVMEAVRLLKKLGMRPRRTIRVVLYADEEMTQQGGRDYARRYAETLPLHFAALECDAGAFAPAGFGVRGDSTMVDHVRRLAAPLAVLGADPVNAGWAGVDVSFIVKKGVTGIGHRVHGEHYFDVHHSPADTFDKIDAGDLARNVAAVAAMAYSLAEDESLPRPVIDKE